jgi:hypothetical protein
MATRGGVMRPHRQEPPLDGGAQQARREAPSHSRRAARPGRGCPLSTIHSGSRHDASPMCAKDSAPARGPVKPPTPAGPRPFGVHAWASLPERESSNTINAQGYIGLRSIRYGLRVLARCPARGETPVAQEGPFPRPPGSEKRASSGRPRLPLPFATPSLRRVEGHTLTSLSSSTASRARKTGPAARPAARPGSAP